MSRSVFQFLCYNHSWTLSNTVGRFNTSPTSGLRSTLYNKHGHYTTTELCNRACCLTLRQSQDKIDLPNLDHPPCRSTSFSSDRQQSNYVCLTKSPTGTRPHHPRQYYVIVFHARHSQNHVCSLFPCLCLLSCETWSDTALFFSPAE